MSNVHLPFVSVYQRMTDFVQTLAYASAIRNSVTGLLRFSDFMICNAFSNFPSEPVHISDLKHCRKIKFNIYVHHTLIYTNCDQWKKKRMKNMGT